MSFPSTAKSAASLSIAFPLPCLSLIFSFESFTLDATAGVGLWTKIGHCLMATITFGLFIIPLLLGGAGCYGNVRLLHFKLFAHTRRNAGFVFSLSAIITASVLLQQAESMQFAHDSSADPYISISAYMAMLYVILLLVSMAFLSSDLQRE